MAKTTAVYKSNQVVVNRNRKMAFCFLLPNIIGFAVFTLIPAVWAIGLSFTNWDGSGAAKFVGIKNYINLFRDSNFTISLWNTIIYTVGTVPFIIMLSLVMAFILDSGIKFSSAIRAAHFFPHISSIVAISVVWPFLE